ncbi:MAG: AsmA-like C-terminal region-containing protein [Deltaproteobacteria bacterium]
MMQIQNSKKKRPFWKKIILGTLSFLLIIFIILLTLPFLFRGKLDELVKREIGKHLNANVEYSSTKLSFIKSFPNLNAGIRDFKITGVGEFEGKTLLNLRELSLVIDIFSLFSKDNKYRIKFFSIKEPIVSIIISPDGKANYDIFKDQGQSENSQNTLKLDLDNYEIKNAKIEYNDQKGMMMVLISGLNHEGKGNFGAGNFLLSTRTLIDSLTYTNSGISMVRNARIDSKLDMQADLNKMEFILKDNSLKINDLVLQSTGKIESRDEQIGIDLKITAPGNNFKEIFSLVPFAYTKDYQDIEARGKFRLAGNIKGIYKYDGTEFPNFSFNLNASEGYIKYPALKIPVEKINADVQIFKQTGNLDNLNVNINPLTFTIGGERFYLRSLVQNLSVDPETIGEVKGILNLGNLSGAFPLDGIEKLSGKIAADIVFNVNQSFTKKKLSGTAKFEQVSMKYSDLPGLKIETAFAEFNNDKIICRNVNLLAGKSDFSGDLIVSEPFNYTRDNEKISLIFNTKSRFIDADEWTGTENKSSKSPSEIDNSNLINLLNKKLTLKFNTNVAAFKFDDYDLKSISATGNLDNNTLSLEKINMMFSGSNFSVSGKLSQIISWALEDKELIGFLNIASPYFDLDKFMGTSDTPSNTPSTDELFTLPAKMNLDIRTKIGKINYTGKELTDLEGNMVLSDQKISFDNVRSSGFGGEFVAAGYLNTKTGNTPDYNVNLNINRMRYEQLYKQLTSFSALMPVVKFINGVFNAEFNVKGGLKNDLTPVLESINAIGMLETVNGMVKSFPGLNEAGEKLNLPVMNNIRLDDVKGRFEVSNGIVKVSPFDVKYEDILFNISGINRLDKTIDYTIRAKIPREKFDKIPAGRNVNSGLELITSQARAKGLDISLGEFINLDILISGPVLKPKVKLEYKGSEGKSVKKTIEDKAATAIEDSKKRIENEFDARKKEAETKAQEIIDSTKRKAEEKARQTAEDLKKKAQKELENRLDSTTRKKADDLLNKYNPFKKKK